MSAPIQPQEDHCAKSAEDICAPFVEETKQNFDKVVEQFKLISPVIVFIDDSNTRHIKPST